MLSRTEIENRIKASSDKSWFLPSQLTAYEELIPFLGKLHRVVNLYGLQGVGKTFLARVLSSEDRVAYVASPDLLCHSDLPLVVDNASFERSAAGGIRNQMRRFDLHQVVMVTRYRVEDSVPAFSLVLTSDDVRSFRSNLFRYLDVRLPDCSALNLWEHLKLIGGT